LALPLTDKSFLVLFFKKELLTSKATKSPPKSSCMVCRSLETRLMSRYATPLTAAMVLVSSAALAQPVTGPYVSLGGGANFLQDERIRENPFFPPSKLSFQTGEDGIGAIGYGFGNGFRVEIEGDYRRNNLQGFTGLASPAGVGGNEQNYGALANVIFDMDVRSPYIYPYLGVGAGYSWTHLNRITAAALDGSYDFAAGGTQGLYTYQALFGVSMPIPFLAGLSLTAEYRFYSVVGNTSFPDETIGTAATPGSHGGTLVHDSFGYRSDYNHALMLGVRYELFPPPPPAPAAPASAVPPASPPPVAETRTYLVFFDWDRADLTDRARQIVAEAAQASTHVQTTRIDVSGYTDLSGTPAYNQGLSVRRAKSVEAELIRDGVAPGEIDIHGYGESNPLVPTAPGVREPQNRRVEIVLK
jgi:outer membrane protein OmpA-like peptidoglycan-associated protein